LFAKTLNDINVDPEDIKFSPTGRVFAVSSSKMSKILFYSFDPTSNTFGRNLPIAQLKSPEARLHFPHGIAFSKDGTIFAVTQFGDVVIAKLDSIPSTIIRGPHLVLSS